MTVGVVNNWNNLGVVGAITPDSIITPTIRVSTFIVDRNSPPNNAGSPGQQGEIVVAPGFIYVCTAPNTWQRVAVATW
jgi:hypothetical protein